MFYLVIIYKSFIAPKALIFTVFISYFYYKIFLFSIHVYLNIQPEYKGQNWKLLNK